MLIPDTLSYELLQDNISDSILLERMSHEDITISNLLANTDINAVWLFFVVLVLGQLVAGSLYTGMRGLHINTLPGIIYATVAGAFLYFVLERFSPLFILLVFVAEGFILWYKSRKILPVFDIFFLLFVMITTGFAFAGLASFIYLVY